MPCMRSKPPHKGNNKMIIKKHIDREGKVVLAVCDDYVKGKCFKEDGLQLDLSSNFYDGDKKSEEEIIEMIKEAYIVNMAGENSVNLGIRAGIIDEDKVLRIEGIPHAEAVIVREE
ncbi:DUF424 family protein [Candidatus Woesearchaeota archaeon]|nr:DUF424 family protein [Candidatus Woesearchaeota archaeon]